jgi:hypothetical protein
VVIVAGGVLVCLGGEGLTCNAALREGAFLIELHLYSTESVEVVRKAVVRSALYY